MSEDSKFDKLKEDLEVLLLLELKDFVGNTVLAERVPIVAESIRSFLLRSSRGEPNAKESLEHAMETLKLILARQKVQVRDRILLVVDRVSGLLLRFLA